MKKDIGIIYFCNLYFNDKKFYNFYSCFSTIGRIKDAKSQIIYDDSCLNYSNALHELMHTIGLSHEHQRPDFDKYITINQSNIRRSMF